MKQTATTPTTRESAAAQRLAEALLEFMIAIEEGREGRRALRPRDEVAVRVEHVHTPAGTAVPRAAAEVSPKPPTGASDRRLLTAKEAAKHLSIGARLLWSMSAPRGPIPVVRLGNAVRYPLAELDAAILRMQLKPRKDLPERP